MNDNPLAAVDVIAQISAVPTILDVVCKTTGMRFAAVARVTQDRWICCGVQDNLSFGLEPGGELKIESTICNEIRDHRQAVIIDNVAEDPHYATHHTPQIYGLQSYISVPITLDDGSFFGTLCAIDTVPRTLNTPEIAGMFTLFAKLIAFHLEAHDRTDQERQASELREQFIAVLGHDLRNPLASIDAGTRMLQRTVTDDKGKSVIGLMQKSISRMSGLIDNVLDFARGRLGGGIPIEQADEVPLRPVLEQVVAELRMANPERRIDSELTDTVVRCDEGRIGQLLSNLLANALTHGDPEGPIQVVSSVVEDRFELSVANGGEPIPEQVVKDMFKPFVRAADSSSAQGLGLGLYISSEIAKAHKGKLQVVSPPEETRFTFSMPLR
ncbi:MULTISPECIES: GAF domain-containing sensor histidine kinase [unclassified Rhizobium]|uniref:GAF domain-containing sensor histidine kinase n=1 Tax=unclassified Rhizobium TaxID=2613769 RepID=UPI00071614F7|nr:MULTISPECIES: GAF domain-containing sensor histidine kinase [unclassified Rhizobium]KQS90423.1 histidine kinase [Rhizobium sp. Leaf386]KQS90672.1 histidine kinase [Rhizobium sp. Leaf391]